MQISDSRLIINGLGKLFGYSSCCITFEKLPGILSYRNGKNYRLIIETSNPLLSRSIWETRSEINGRVDQRTNLTSDV